MSLHVPMPGHCAPKSGPALCGRQAVYPIADHALIAYLARTSRQNGPYCERCRLEALRLPPPALRPSLYSGAALRDGHYAAMPPDSVGSPAARQRPGQRALARADSLVSLQPCAQSTTRT